MEINANTSSCRNSWLYNCTEHCYKFQGDAYMPIEKDKMKCDFAERHSCFPLFNEAFYLELKRYLMQEFLLEYLILITSAWTCSSLSESALSRDLSITRTDKSNLLGYLQSNMTTFSRHWAEMLSSYLNCNDIYKWR